MCCDFVHFQPRFVFGIVAVTVAVGFAVAIRYKKSFNHGLIFTYSDDIITTENQILITIPNIYIPTCCCD